MDDLKLQEVFEHGRDTGRGNMVGIQPFMDKRDYASQANFMARINAYFTLAKEQGWLSRQSIVILPEYIGTWLVTAGESPAVSSAATIPEAMRLLALRHPARFLVELLRAREQDRAAAALFRIKADSMARIYTATFADLARAYGVTVAAGSILLPNPRVVEGRVMAGRGALYNTAFIFRPDGRAEDRFAQKYRPVYNELPFITQAPVKDLPVFDTPAGKLGLLVCADSWYPEAYQRLKEQGAELIAVPSASSPGDIWENPWGGYSGWPAPGDVDLSDVGKLTERQAWGKYALASRLGSAGARAGINVFLYGDLWDLNFTGGLWRIVCGDTDLEGSCYGPALINLWL